MLLGCCHCGEEDPPSESAPPSESSSVSESESESRSESTSSSDHDISEVENTCSSRACIDSVFARRYRVVWAYDSATPPYCGQVVSNLILHFGGPFFGSCYFNTLNFARRQSAFAPFACFDDTAYTVGVMQMHNSGFNDISVQFSLVSSLRPAMLGTVTYTRAATEPPLNCLAPIVLNYFNHDDAVSFYQFHHAATGLFVSTMNPHPHPPTITLVPV
jgi:hypothetical protein